MFVWIAGLVWLKCIDERFEKSVQKALERADEVVGSYYHRQVILELVWSEITPPTLWSDC